MKYWVQIVIIILCGFIITRNITMLKYQKFSNNIAGYSILLEKDLKQQQSYLENVVIFEDDEKI